MRRSVSVKATYEGVVLQRRAGTVSRPAGSSTAAVQGLILVDLADYGSPKGCTGTGSERSAEVRVRSKLLLEPSSSIDSPVAHVISNDLHPVILPDTNTPTRKEEGERPENIC